MSSSITFSSLLTTLPPPFLSSFFSSHCQLLRCALPVARCSPLLLDSYRNKTNDIDDRSCRRTICSCGDCLPDRLKGWLKATALCAHQGSLNLVEEKIPPSRTELSDGFIIRLDSISYDISRERDCASLTVDYPAPPLTNPFSVAYYHCIALLRNPTKLLMRREI